MVSVKLCSRLKKQEVVLPESIAKPSYGLCEELLYSRLKKQEVLPGSKAGVGVVNFPHFSRPFAHAKANLESLVGARNNQAMIIDSAPPVVEDNTVKNKEEGQSSSLGVEKGTPDHEDNPIVEFSSTGSATSGGAPAGSNYGRGREAINPEQEGKVVVKNAAEKQCGNGKRSGIANVHTLSEKRRRDEVNGKMHMLQNLVPNSNKVDKASMLDEAIEYIKGPSSAN